MRRATVIGAAVTVLMAGAVSGASGSTNTISFSGYTWHMHDGVGGLCQRWSSSHVHLSGGVLSINVSGGVGGGITMPSVNRTYGTYQVRFRMSRGAGKYVILLWPQSGSRPEIDFAEDKPEDSARSLMTGTWHPKPGCIACIHLKTSGNFAAWHTAGLIWRPTGLTFTLDGRPWAHISQTSHKPMHLEIQANCVPGRGNCSTSSVLQVSSVRIGR